MLAQGGEPPAMRQNTVGDPVATAALIFVTPQRRRSSSNGCARSPAAAKGGTPSSLWALARRLAERPENRAIRWRRGYRYPRQNDPTAVSTDDPHR